MYFTGCNDLNRQHLAGLRCKSNQRGINTCRSWNSFSANFISEPIFCE